MKSKSALIIAILLFIGVNTLFIWKQITPASVFFVFLIFRILSFLLFFVFILKIGGGLIDKFKNRNNNISVGIIGFVLAFCFFYPAGILRSSDFDPEYYLIASQEGTANCSTSIILAVDNSFIERNVCFKIEEREGTYTIQNDTVYFSFKKNSTIEPKQTYGLLKLSDSKVNGNYGKLIYYRDMDGEKPLNLYVNQWKK